MAQLILRAIFLGAFALSARGQDSSSTAAPTTEVSTTAAPVTTAAPTTEVSTTAAPVTTAAPTTGNSATATPLTTAAPTIGNSATAAPLTTAAPTTENSATATSLTTAAPTTGNSATATSLTTAAPTTGNSATAAPLTTAAPTTGNSTTAVPLTTAAPTTGNSATAAPLTTAARITGNITTAAPLTPCLMAYASTPNYQNCASLVGAVSNGPAAWMQLCNSSCPASLSSLSPNCSTSQVPLDVELWAAIAKIDTMCSGLSSSPACAAAFTAMNQAAGCASCPAPFRAAMNLTCPMGSSTAAPPTIITGSLGLTVSNASAFVADASNKVKVASGIALAVGVPADYVSVTLTVEITARRLASKGSSDQRRLAQLVKATYSITIPSNAPSSLPTPSAVSTALAQTTTLATQIAASTGTQVSVTTITAPNAPTTSNPTNATTSKPKSGNASGAESRGLTTSAAALILMVLGVINN